MSSAAREFDGQAVTVMGLGGFGGGLGVVRFLHSRGARVTVSDRRSADGLAGSLKQWPDIGRVKLHLGGHQEADFLRADVIVVNPAVRPGHPLVDRARRRGIHITSEINLFWERCRGHIAGVTGTNGKSTTTRLLHHLLEAAGRRAWLGGNIGGSLLAEADRIREDDWVVLELSSFQLASLDELRVSPEVSVVTNFAPNHLDWHETVESYRQAKQTIFRWQHREDVSVVNAVGDVSEWETRSRRMKFDGREFSQRWADALSKALRAAHQRENAAAAVAAARAIGIGDEPIREGLRCFVGLPHRLQNLGDVEGRTWIDDSASTTPESTLAALASFAQPVVLLAGGADKGVDLTALADGVVTWARAAILMGSVAARLDELIRSRRDRASRMRSIPLTTVRLANSFEEAVIQARAVSQPGDVLLLSPGCASYGWFANYVERGDAFSQCFRQAAESAPVDSRLEPC